MQEYVKQLEEQNEELKQKLAEAEQTLPQWIQDLHSHSRMFLVISHKPKIILAEIYKNTDTTFHASVIASALNNSKVEQVMRLVGVFDSLKEAQICCEKRVSEGDGNE